MQCFALHVLRCIVLALCLFKSSAWYGSESKHRGNCICARLSRKASFPWHGGYVTQCSTVSSTVAGACIGCCGTDSSTCVPGFVRCSAPVCPTGPAQWPQSRWLERRDTVRGGNLCQEKGSSEAVPLWHAAQLVTHGSRQSNDCLGAGWVGVSVPCISCIA
jgi:hypothetical protein